MGAVDRLKRFFNIDYKKSAKELEDKIQATKRVPNKNGDGTKVVRDVFPSKVQELFNWWISDTHASLEEWKNRKALWRDCDEMYYNSPLIARAIELTADEVIQCETSNEIIQVDAKQKQKKFIQNFLKDIDINKHIRPTAVDVIQYGNCPWVLSFDDNGVDEVIPTEIYQLKERLEFTPYEVESEKNNNYNFRSYVTNTKRIEYLIDMVENKDNMASYFKRYLFGYRIGEYLLPPWRALHFRNMTYKSPFQPFGVPVYIHSIAPYKQYDSALTMQIAARGINFPKDVYKLIFPEGTPPSEKLAKAQELSIELQNSGLNGTVKEVNGVGEVIITIEGLYEYTQETPNLDLGKIDDIEMLRDEIIVSLFIPRNLIDPNDSGFGDSGVSLVEKFKPYARLVYRIQQILLQNISQLIKIHMIHSNEFTVDEIDFSLSMTYPESITNSDIISSQEDLIGLANLVIDTFSDKYLDGEDLPDDIITDIYQKFLPYDSDVLNKWIKEIEKEKKNNDEAGIGGDDDTERETEQLAEKVKKIKWRKFVENTGKQEVNHLFEDIIFEKKQNAFTEGLIKGKHFYSSRNKFSDFPAEWLEELSVKNIKAIFKEDKKLGTIKEEYVFKSKKEDVDKEDKKWKMKKKK